MPKVRSCYDSSVLIALIFIHESEGTAGVSLVSPGFSRVRTGSGGVQDLAGRVPSSQEVFEISRDGSPDGSGVFQIG